MSVLTGITVAVISFLLQLALLSFTEKRALRLLPLWILLAGAVVTLLCWTGILIENDGGYINAGAITALLVVMGLAFWAAGIAAAWLVRALVRKRRQSQSP